MHWDLRGSGFDVRAGIRVLVGPGLTALLAIALAFLARSTPGVANPTTILLLGVVFSAFVGGLASGFLAAGVLLLFRVLAERHPGAILGIEQPDLIQVTVFAVVSVLIVLLVDGLRRRLDTRLAAAVVERAAAEHARDDALERERWNRTLAEIGGSLEASLDIPLMLERLARVAVSDFADLCTIVLSDERGAVLHREVAHADPVREPLARQLEAALAPIPGSPLDITLRNGVPIVGDAFDTSVFDGLDIEPEKRELMERVGIFSHIVVPLRARDRTLGAIAFGRSTPDARYGPADLAMASEIARRAALAIDNSRLFQEAQEASRAKSDFLAVVSHELRTPLTTIMGYTDLLLAGVPAPLPDPSRAFVDRIRTASWHLLGVIEQILLYARMDVGREEVHPERTTLAALAHDAAALVEPVAAEKGLRLIVDVAEPDAPIETDLTKLRQILLNLLANAVKFTEQGEVRLQIATNGDSFVFRVSDTGRGIPPEYRERVFEPFWQVDSPDTRRIGGPGLGLSVARRLARFLGGDLCLEASGADGSSFLLCLPSSAVAAG